MGRRVTGCYSGLWEVLLRFGKLVVEFDCSLLIFQKEINIHLQYVTIIVIDASL
jgi:hypothetical protein